MTTITASTWRRALEMVEYDNSTAGTLHAMVTILQTSDVDWTAPPLPDYKPGSAKTWDPTGIEVKLTSRLVLATGGMTHLDMSITVHGGYRLKSGEAGKLPLKLQYRSRGDILDPRDLRSIRFNSWHDSRVHPVPLPAWVYEITDKLSKLPPQPWALVLREALG
jgi:hypothetical protein